MQNAQRTIGDIEDTRQALENEIAGYETRIIHTKRKLNGLIPICRLPPELLSEVLLIWAALARGPLGRVKASKHWIKISHVCHLWRQVALATPSFWGEFKVEGLEWTKMMLSRSKVAPLRIFARECGSNVPALADVFQELYRLQTIALEMADRGDVVSLQPFIGTEAPILESLTIFLPYDRPFPVYLFDHVDAPRLSYLYLYNTPTIWNSPLLKPTLEHLCLYCSESSHGSVSSGADMAHIASILGSMQGLRSLTLKYVFPALDGNAHMPRVIRTVKLLRLHQLHVSATTMTCAHFLRYFEFSKDITLEIYCTDCKPSVLSDSLIPSIITTFENPLLGSKWLPLAALCHDKMIRLWTGALALSQFEEACLDDLSDLGHILPTLTLRCVYNPSFNPLPILYRTLPLGGVETLVHGISWKSPPRRDYWIDALRHFPSLRNFGVHCSVLAMLELNDALCEETHPPHGDGSVLPRPAPQLLLPSLQALSLDLAIFQTAPSDSEGALPSYLRMLQTRRDRGCGIQRLVIRRGININPPAVEMLSKLVEVVDWDEKY